MDARAQAAARAVPVVVAGVVVGGGGELRGEGGDVGVVVWFEGVRVWEAGGVVVQAPAVDDDGATFGQELPVYPVI